MEAPAASVSWLCKRRLFGSGRVPPCSLARIVARPWSAVGVWGAYNQCPESGIRLSQRARHADKKCVHGRATLLFRSVSRPWRAVAFGGSHRNNKRDSLPNRSFILHGGAVHGTPRGHVLAVTAPKSSQQEAGHPWTRPGCAHSARSMWVGSAAFKAQMQHRSLQR